jgi:hypothetical protein
MLAEGVDFFAPSDHDFVHDISDTITAMGATGLVATTPSSELTTYSYGHFNMWPYPVDPLDRTGGAFDWGDSTSPAGAGFPSLGEYDVEPASIYAAFSPATQVIQINHLNSTSWGHFYLLGVDTENVPPETSNRVYRCSGGSRIGLPCQVDICSGGTSDGADCAVISSATCTSGGGTCLGVPVGRGCPGASCDDVPDNLASFLRMDPSIANLYDDGYTALEVWIESTREQTDRFLHENMGDWAGLLNQGRFKSGIADSDTHQTTVIQAGTPRSFVASTTDDPGSISAAALALNVNAGRVIGTNGPFLRITLEGDAAATASHDLGDPLTAPATGGAGTVNIHVESPTWAEYDRIEVYANAAPGCVSRFNFIGVVDQLCDLVPTVALDAGIDFTVTPTVGVSGSGTRNVTDVSVPLAVSSDTWVIVVVRGRDGVSKPLFPIVSQDLLVMTCDSFGNQDGDPCVSDATCGIGVCVNKTLSELTDGGVSPPWNLNEEGALATAFSNPLFFDFEGDGFCHGGSACP